MIKTKLRHYARYGLIYPLLFMACISVIFSAVTYWSLGTQTGRLWVSKQVFDKVSAYTSWKIKHNGLVTPELGHWHFSHLQVYRDDTLFFAGKNMTLRWEPRWLLRKRIGIYEFSSDTIDLYLPLSSDEKAPERAEPPTFNLKGVPDIILDLVAVKHMSIHVLNADKSTSHFNYQVNMDARIVRHSLPHLNLSIESLDEHAFSATLHTRIENGYSDQPTVALRAELSEAKDGFIGKQLQLLKAQDINAQLNAQVRLQNNQFLIDLEFLRLSLLAPHLNRAPTLHTMEWAAKLALGLSPLELALNKSTLSIDKSTQKIIGQWKENSLNAMIDINELDLDFLSLWVSTPIEGQLSGKLEAHGHINDIKWSSHLRANSRFNSVPIKAELISHGILDKITLDKFSLDIAKMHMQAKGNLDISHDKYNLSYALSNINDKSIKDIRTLLPSPLDTQVNDERLSFSVDIAKGRLHGKLKQLQSASHIKISGAYKHSSDQQIPFNVSTDIIHRDATVALKDFNFTIDQEESTQAMLQANINLSSLKAQITSDIRNFPTQILRVVGVDVPENVDAKINLSTQINGTMTSDMWARSEVNLSAQVEGSFEDTPFTSTLNAKHINDKTEITHWDIHSFNDLIVDVNGYFQGTLDNNDIQANVTLNTLPAPLLTALDLSFLQGKHLSKLSLSGSTQEPILNGHINYTTQLVDSNDDSHQNYHTLEWSSKIQTLQDNIIISSSSLFNDTQNGHLDVSIPIMPYLGYFSGGSSHDKTDVTNLSAPSSMPLDINIIGDINLNNLGLVVDPDLHQFDGTVKIHAEVKGHRSNPNISGYINLAGARYDNALSGTSLSDIECKIEAQDIQLRISKCSASDTEKGRFELTGETTLPFYSLDKKNIPHSPPQALKKTQNDEENELGNIDLSVKMTNANIIKRRDIQSHVTGEITISGDFRDLWAKGLLEITPLTINIDVPTSANIPHIEVTEVYPDKDTQEDTVAHLELPTVNVDLSILASQQAFIRGRGLESELQGKLVVKGDINNPVYSGDFATKRGRIEIFGKNFDLETGEVSVANDALTLMIKAKHETSTADIITAELSGSLDDLTIKLSSIPSMAEDEILAYLIFGKNILNITPFQAIQLAVAVQSLSSGGGKTFDPINKTRKLLGVDTLSINTAEDESGNKGLDLGVGKYLNEKVYLELQRTADPAHPWKASIDVEITPGLSVESSASDTAGIEGAELKWKHDY